MFVVKFLVCLVTGFFFSEFLGWNFHRFLHTKWAFGLQTNHLIHHTEKYPPEDYLSKDYRVAGKANTLYPFLVAGVLVAGLFFWLAPLWLSIPMAIDLALVGFLNDRAHLLFHVTPNFLEKSAWFARLRERHLTHHENMTLNFGIFTFFTDRLFKTFKE